MTPWQLGLTILLVTALAVLIVGRLARWGFERHGDMDPIATKSSAKIIRIGIAVVGIGAALHAFGVHPTALFATGGMFALGAGFAAKDLIANFLSGLLLRVEQTVRPDDLIEVKGLWLIIRKVGFRTTTARTYNEEEVMIPNSVLTQSIVTSITRHDRLYRLEAKIGVAYSSDLKMVRKTLEETASGLEWRSKAKDPAVYLKSFGDSSVEFDVYVWIDDAGTALGGRSNLNEALWWALQDAGIVIAFPQLDVHLDARPTSEQISAKKSKP